MLQDSTAGLKTTKALTTGTSNDSSPRISGVLWLSGPMQGYSLLRAGPVSKAGSLAGSPAPVRTHPSQHQSEPAISRSKQPLAVARHNNAVRHIRLKGKPRESLQRPSIKGVSECKLLLLETL